MPDLAPKTVASTLLEMGQIMEPNDANFLGKVFGGSILAMLDLCAYATASKFAGTICVTASLDRVDFHEPINVGELVTMAGRVGYAGRTSVEVTIEVYAENLLQGTRRHTNTARVNMVALGPDLKPTEVPKLVCESREEKIQFLEGKLRREMRANQRAEQEALEQKFRQSPDEDLDSLLSAKTIGKR